MSECPGFLDVPIRSAKPRSRGITHVLDKGLTTAATCAWLAQTAHLVDIAKIGWGIGYVDPMLWERVAVYRDAGVSVCLGGTLLEVAAVQDRVAHLKEWALRTGVTHIEVSNGLRQLTRESKTALIRELSEDFVVIAETGAKDGSYPDELSEWDAEMTADLEAGASWLVAEGRESGTVGLYNADQSVREDVVSSILALLPLDRVIFEAPAKPQQTWFVRAFGAEVNLGNIAPDDVLPLETLRLGLRADTVPLGAPA